MLAESGIVQFMPRVRRSLPRMSAMINTPDTPTEIVPMPGSGIGIAPIRNPRAMPMPMEM